MDLLSAPTEAIPKPIVIVIKGIRVPLKKEPGKDQRYLTAVPSFKTGKMAFGWMDPVSKKIMARPLTNPDHKKWMDQAILSIESQLLCALQITREKMRMVASARSWIALRVPLDDSWRWCPEILVKSESCAPGDEGAVIEIHRLR